MPVVAVNLAPSVFTEIHALVARGLYASPEQFLEIAAFNQVALERGARPDELPARSKAVQAPQSPSPSSKDRDKRQEPAPKRKARRAARVRRRSADAPKLAEAGAPFRLPAEQVQTRTRPTEPRPVGERLWGQVNRLFPMKLVCRWLLVQGPLALEEAAPQLGQAASSVGTALEALDNAAARKREDVLATGLPRVGNVASMDRFLSQYLARTTRAGDIYTGAVSHYALAVFDGERPTLTDCGVEFARLTNPVLDLDAEPERSLSDAEREFLVRHVLRFVPAERHDFVLVSRAISKGAATPDDLLLAVRESFPREWTDVMARTHLSGLVARMSDIGALRRDWEGRRVTYEITPTGQKFAHAPEEMT